MKIKNPVLNCKLSNEIETSIDTLLILTIVLDFF